MCATDINSDLLLRMYIFALFTIITSKFVFCLEEDYYWREYTGTIPEDALVGGQDINSKNIHIGQGYVNGHGLIVSEIIPGIKTVDAPINGVKKVEAYIKILCGRQENFYWNPANATHLHLQLIDKKPVIGGHETGGVLFVGRINHEGNIKIGKIVSFFPENARMFFSYRGKELSTGSYEILLYNNKNLDVRIGG